MRIQLAAESAMLRSARTQIEATKLIRDRKQKLNGGSSGTDEKADSARRELRIMASIVGKLSTKDLQEASNSDHPESDDFSKIKKLEECFGEMEADAVLAIRDILSAANSKLCSTVSEGSVTSSSRADPNVIQLLQEELLAIEAQHGATQVTFLHHNNEVFSFLIPPGQICFCTCTEGSHY